MAIIYELGNALPFYIPLLPMGIEKSFLRENFYMVVIALMYWFLGYFAPEATTRMPLKLLNTYILLPIWLNGILRKKRSTGLPDGVVSTVALGAQFGALFLFILYLGFYFQWPFLQTRFVIIYGVIVCVFLGVSFAILISKFWPYPPKTK